MPHAKAPIASDAYILANVQIFAVGGKGVHPLQVAVNMLSKLTEYSGVKLCALRWEKDDITSFTTLEMHEAAPNRQTLISTYRQAKALPPGAARTWHHDQEGI